MKGYAGMWDYSDRTVGSYGCDTTYRKAAAFLDDGPVEDWGCGRAYARGFFKNKYVGVDGAPGLADKIADLTLYTSKVHGILMRHVLEHNENWKTILLNALASAEKKLALVIFTPFSNVTHQMDWNVGYEVPDISFRKEDLTSVFISRKWSEETMKIETKYGIETIFYIYTGLSASRKVVSGEIQLNAEPRWAHEITVIK
jgi:hypothetical protein